METLISDTLKLIKDQTGLELQLCDYFTGLQMCEGVNYFNVILKDRVWCSKEYDILTRFANKYNLIRVESCGPNRISIFIIEK